MRVPLPARAAALLCAPLLAGCFLQQRLDADASSAVGLPLDPTPTVDGGGPAPPAGGPAPVTSPPIGMAAMPVDGAAGRADAPTPPSAVGGAMCDQTRAHAHMILEANCAFCHQAPSTLGGSFNFILDFDKLANAISTSGTRFTVPGAPEQSRLYQRVSASEMPPPGRMPRPGEGDVVVLYQWIARCPIAGPGGAPPDAGVRPDAGAAEVGPGPGCGNPGQDCCAASTCNSGGCCVQGQCRGNGLPCGDGVGQAGIAGTCTNGSCQNTGNVPCGSLGQGCCVDQPPTCTAPRTTCATSGATMMCQGCGGSGQPCCVNGGITTCLSGLGCLDVGFGRTGSCQPCGAAGQRCCGSGPVPLRVCNAGLHCEAEGGSDACKSN